jgi:transposase
LIHIERLVFLDESYCATGMRREHAWSKRGRRAVGTRPFGRWKTVSLIGAVRVGVKPKLMTHRGSVNGRVFLRFVRTRLCPWLRKGDIVFMDNLRAHKVAGVREAIEAAGAFVIYLPPYSPDLNPIELWWADLKRQLRGIALDTEEGLRAAVRRLRAALDTYKLTSWFRHCLPHLQSQRSPR